MHTAILIASNWFIKECDKNENVDGSNLGCNHFLSENNTINGNIIISNCTICTAKLLQSDDFRHS
jgi:hypothetical protein